MPKFDRVKAGDILYDVRPASGLHRMYYRWDIWTVRVISIDYEKRTAMCSWNGNKATLYCERNIARLRRTRPDAKQK